MSLFSNDELESFLGLPSGDLDTDRGTLVHDQAVGYLEGELGLKLELVESATVAYQVQRHEPWITLPVPTIDVVSVAVDGTELDADDYSVTEGRLFRRDGWGAQCGAAEYVTVAVELDYGFGTDSAGEGFPVPGELKLWGLVLAKQAYEAPASGRQAVRIDDFSETYATATESVMAAMSLPPQVLGRLRARYGGAVAVVSTR